MDRNEYLASMIDGIKQYQQMKEQLKQLRQKLLDTQADYEDYYYENCVRTCIGDSIVDIVREEMISAGV